MGKNIRSPSTEPHADGRPTYNGVRPGSPRGSFTTLLSLPQCHAAPGTIPSTLAWADRAPLACVCRSNPQQDVPSTTVTASHVTQGRVRIYDTPRYGRGVGFMGGEMRGSVLCNEPSETITNSMDQSPSWESNSSSANQKFPHFMEPESSLPHSQAPATCSYPEPHQPSPCWPQVTSWRSILILSSHLRPGLPSCLFPSEIYVVFTVGCRRTKQEYRTLVQNGQFIPYVQKVTLKPILQLFMQGKHPFFDPWINVIIKSKGKGAPSIPWR